MTKKQTLQQKMLIKLVDTHAALHIQLDKITAHYNKQAEPLKQKMRDIEDKILAFTDEELEGVKTTRAKLKFTPVEVPNIKDWDKFLIYLFKYKMKVADLLKKTIHTTAARERWENNEKIPGVEKVKLRSITITPTKQ